MQDYNKSSPCLKLPLNATTNTDVCRDCCVPVCHSFLISCLGLSYTVTNPTSDFLASDHSSVIPTVQ